MIDRAGQSKQALSCFIKSLSEDNPDKDILSFFATKVISGRTVTYTTEHMEKENSPVRSSFVRVDSGAGRIVKFVQHQCLAVKQHFAFAQMLGNVSVDEESSLHYIDIESKNIITVAVPLRSLEYALVTARDTDNPNRLWLLDF